VADRASSWRNLAEMDLEFARARRRAARRHARTPRARPNVPVWLRTTLLGAVLFGAIALIGRSGALNVSNAQQPKKAAVVVPAGCPVPTQFAAAFVTAARTEHLPLGLLVAVAGQESRFDPAARSGAGAQGLLQLMPETARELRLDPAVPASNVLAGARYLRRMLDRFHGDIDLALAAYNAGPTAVENAGGAPTFGTLTYVQNVKASWHAASACG
jgi:soluble lytic murein transglycosylase-like protein